MLEAVVYSHRAALAVRDDAGEEPTDGSVPAPGCGGAPDAAPAGGTRQVGALIVASARMRTESRGLHYNVDHPFTDERFRADTVVVPGCLDD